MYCDFKVNWRGSFIKHMRNHHSDLMNLQSVGLNGISNPLLNYNMSTCAQKFLNGNENGQDDVDNEISLKGEEIEVTRKKGPLCIVRSLGNSRLLKTQNMSSLDKDLENLKVL